jgi:hypothetical protein
MNKAKIFELKIEEDDDLSGIDSISLVDEPAIEINWVAFNKVKPQEFVIPDGDDLKYSEMVTQKGQSEEELLNDGWEVVKQEFLSSSPNAESIEDTNEYLIRYKYIKNPEAPGADIKETTRDFCVNVLLKNFVYRVEDLDAITNDEGDSAMVWRGGYNCRHIWQQITYKRDAKIVNKGSVTKGREDGLESLDVLGLPQPDTRTSNPSFNKEKFESYSDYPDSVKNNAKAVLKYVDENGWGSCGTDVGKGRANDLAQGNPISEDTIKRMYSYLSRHKVDLESSKSYDDGCGKLMYDSWGGLSALSWSESKVNSFNKFEVGIPHYTEDGKLYEGPTHKNADGKLMTGAVHSEDSEYLYHKDELDEILIICKECGHSWDMEDGGKDAYVCHKCGYDNFGYDNNLPYYVDELPKKKKKSYLDQFEYLFTQQTNNKQHFQTDIEKKIVLGPAMIPDMKIFRKDKNGDPYYVFFSADTIKMIAEKYMKNKYLDNNDMMHDGQAVPDVYVTESWIKEDDNDKSVKYGYGELPIGTWFVAMKVKNDAIWAKVKDHQLNGFSVSGFFEEVATFRREEAFLKELAEILKKIK